MDKLFLDANVVIDFLCQRNGFYLPAAKIIAKGYKLTHQPNSESVKD